jgi:putative ABC transport system permease protein
LLKPLPFRDPERVVRITNMRDGNRMVSSAPDFIDWRTQTKSFSSMAAIDNQPMNLTGGADPEACSRGARRRAVLEPARRHAEAGPWIRARRGCADRGRVAVLSDGLWKRRFGADRRIVGKSVSLDGNSYTVIGVAPERFSYPTTRRVVPLVFSANDLDQENRGAHWMGVIGRLAPNVTVAQATSEMVALTSGSSKHFPESKPG